MARRYDTYVKPCNLCGPYDETPYDHRRNPRHHAGEAWYAAERDRLHSSRWDHAAAAAGWTTNQASNDPWQYLRK